MVNQPFRKLTNVQNHEPVNHMALGQGPLYPLLFTSQIVQLPMFWTIGYDPYPEIDHQPSTIYQIW